MSVISRIPSNRFLLESKRSPSKISTMMLDWWSVAVIRVIRLRVVMI
jgi:hypothetical protein